MSTTNAAILTVSSLSLVVSAATLCVVLVGAKKVKDEASTARLKASEVLDSLRGAINKIDI